MPALPTDVATLATLAFALGLRHGLDADHLAVIDGLSRLNAGRRFGRWCGALFALGHGAVVIAVALLAALATRQAAPPAWVEPLGAWVSIACLGLLGAVNLHALLSAAPGAAVATVGLKSRWLGRLRHAGHPAGVAAIGLLFAFSLDTLAQAALFGAAAGPAAALGLAALFALGMLLVDGLNGLWVSRLIRCSDRASLVASRVMSAVIAGASLLLAALGAARRLSPTLDGWTDTNALALGVCLLALLVVAWALARALARIQITETHVGQS